MRPQFSQIPKAEIPRSSFDRSHGYKTTFDAGFLIPFYVDEALPGDTFNLRTTAFARLATPIKPIMDNLFMETFFFSVPVRQVWDNWEKFNGEQTNPGDSTDFTIPTMLFGASPGEGTIHDYMGLPVGFALRASCLQARAYNHIYNNWFRDQNLIDSVDVNTDDGPDQPGDYALLRRRKRHDYFTGCLPFPQKGEEVTVPIGDSAPISSTEGTIGGHDMTVIDADDEGSVWDFNAGLPKLEFGASDTGISNIFADLSLACVPCPAGR